MIANRITFVVISLLLLLAFAPFALRFQLAQALTDASSSTTTIQSDSLPASTTTAIATTTPAPITQSASVSASVSAPPALAVVHIIGTKYVDYCTDGTKVTPYPGDAAVDANLNKPDAPTPKCPNGLKWDHTSGMDKYDTPSGDLDVGGYAQQADGSYIVHYAASTYTDATSTSSWSDRVVTMKTLPAAQPPTQSSAAMSPPATTTPSPAATSSASTTSTQ